MSAKDTLIYGVELAFQFANPVLLFFAPLAYLATWTNFAFIAQVSRMAPKQRGLHRQPNAIVVGVAVVVNVLGVFSGGFLTEDLYRFPAVWVWLTSFVVLFVAVLSNEN
ncbi:hypothetical protein [Roseateles oligotrophus]|uniref:Uncharacterized protein n=1 Tax=Roseateles oligotrophus TaxID=1769250 RepID=A0ABT2YAC3_9BURK|nr:hypothetical protein [Roseateles oligotrophus]MCV2367005.1 hypothetical protein [Roseateles oligotrophus]